MIRAAILLAILGSVSVAHAATTCTYSTSYDQPGLDGVCFVDAVAGCPVHVVLPHEPTPPDLEPQVYDRNGQPVTVTATTSVVGSVAPVITTIDYDSCTCDRTTAPMAFDELAVQLAGAKAGDIVAFGGDSITIAPSTGSCAPPDWPTEADFQVQNGGCDLCPVDPGSGGAHGARAAGCSATGSAGWALAAGIGLLLAGRRRARR